MSRTDCIAHAKGDYVFFVDSDDWIEEDTVSQMVSATRNGEVDIVGCDFMKDYLSGKPTYHHENYAETCRENMFKCLNYDIATVLWKLLIRRSLFDNFTITPHVDIVEDYIMSVKLYYYANSFVSIPKAFYHYVYGSASLSRRYDENSYKQDIIIRDAFYQLLIDTPSANSIYQSKTSSIFCRAFLFGQNVYSSKDFKDRFSEYYPYVKSGGVESFFFNLSAMGFYSVSRLVFGLLFDFKQFSKKIKNLI